MEERTYSAKVVDSSMELDLKDRIKYSNFEEAFQLDSIEIDTPIIINPTGWVVVAVHNEKSKDSKDYNKYLVLTKDGEVYVTGSDSFWNAFRDIFDQMCEYDGEWGIKVFKSPSKNYKGKNYISCSVV